MSKNIFYFFLLFILFYSSINLATSRIIPPVIVKAEKPLLRDETTTVISQQQITESGTTSLSQALQNLGGLQLQDTTGNASQVLLTMRGFGANANSNTLLLINGIPIINPDLAPPDLNAIPLAEINHIDIIAGSESVLYGDQAVGGVINIITETTMQAKFAFSCLGGSYNLKQCNATLNRDIGAFHFNTTAQAEHTDNYRNHNDYDQQLLVGDVAYNYQLARANFNYKIANESMQYPGALTATEVRQNREQATNDTDFFSDWNGFFHLNYQQAIFNTWLFEADAARRQMSGHGVLFSPFTQSRMINYLKPQLSGRFHQISVKSGMDLENDNYRLNSTFGLTNNAQQKYGLYSLLTAPLTRTLAATIGARGALQQDRLQSSNNTSTLNRAFATTAGLSYQPGADMNFYLRRAENFRFPKADENATAPIGVKNLRTQRGVSYEMGLRPNKKKYAAKAEIYQLNLRDEIAFDPTQTPQQPFGSNQNLSPTMRRGFTLSGTTDITEKLSINGQYNYVNARFQNGNNAGNRIPLVSETIMRAGANYKLTPYWNFYSEAIFTGNQYPANDNANIAGKIGGFTVYNANLRYHYKNLSVSLRVNNIFNKEYYFYTVYQPSIHSEFFYPAPERNIALIINYFIL